MACWWAGCTSWADTLGSQPGDHSHHSSDDSHLSNLPFCRYRNSSRRTSASLKFYLQVAQEEKVLWIDFLLIPLHVLKILVGRRLMCWAQSGDTAKWAAMWLFWEHQETVRRAVLGLQPAELEAPCSPPANKHTFALRPGTHQFFQVFSSWALRKIILEPFSAHFTLFL